MGLFSFGGSSSKSRSRSDSQSSSFDVSDAFGFNFGQSSSQSTSGQSIAFEDIFAQLFGGATGAAGAVNTGALTQTANMLFGSGSQFLGQLGGGAGTDFLQGQLSGSPDIINQQVDQLGADISKFLAEDVNPAITAGGISAGTFGGSRGEVQRGLASEAALREFARGSTQIRAGERDRLTGIASGLMENNLQSSMAGLNALPGLFGLAESGALAGLSPFLALAQILGGPTVLSESESGSESIDFGLDSATGRAGSQSTSTSTSTSKSKSANFGF